MNTKRHTANSTLIAVILIIFFHAGIANAGGTITKCINQPTTLNWSSSNVTSCTPTYSPACSFTATPGQSGSQPISPPANCNVGLTCTGSGGSASDSATLVVDTTKTWNGTACVAAASSCSATTINNCALPTTSSGSSAAGSCSGSGSCNYSCNNGTWSQNSNSCASAAPTASLSASPTSVTSGGRSTLTWSSTNATSCTAGGPWSNAGSLSGSGLTNALVSNSTFTLQCSGPGGTSALQSVTVTVGSGTGCSATTINDCTLPATSSGGSAGSCAPGSISGACNYSCNNGTWSQNSNSCVAPATCSATTISNCVLPTTWSGSSAGSCSGSGSCNYSCSNGTWSSNSNSCVSSAPTASLSASPSTVAVGGSSTLTWSSTNATSCTATGGFSTGGATSNLTGVSVSPSTTTTYQITCSGAGGSAISNATVTIVQPTATITATPARLQSGSSSTIAWSSSNVTSCAVTKNGAAWRAGTSSAGVGDTVTAQTTYTLTCTTTGSPVSQSVIVNVTPGFQQF